MALIYIEFVDNASRPRAAELSEILQVPAYESAAIPDNVESGIRLIVGPNGLALAFTEEKRGKPYVLDFLSPSWASRLKTPPGRQHIFRRAIGAKQTSLRVLDATAGFAQDSLVMLTMGFTVTALERDPVVFTVVNEALARARKESEPLSNLLGRFQLVHVEAEDYLRQFRPEDRPDVIYLDPMFEKPKKSAKSPKEMQILQDLCAPGNNESLFASALKVAVQRVVVKKPLKAADWEYENRGPSHSFKGQSIRYDIYGVK